MIFNFISKSVGRVARLVTVGIASIALASCGGGGGSAGTESNSTGNTGATSLSLQFSSNQINSTSTTPITVTVTALNANNNGVPNVTIQFAANSGVITPAASPAVTNSSGQVTATLAVGSNTTPRTINVTVSGGGVTATGSVQVVGTTGTPTMTILFSPSTLASAGTTTGAVTVSALLQDSNNNALSGVPVSFSATSGVLTVTSATTSATGLATATLNTAGNQANRSITVTATGGGATTSSTIQVIGTTLTASSAPSSLTLGTMQQYTYTLQDSAGNPIANAPVTFKSAAGNTVTGDASDSGSSSAPLTNVNGVVILDVTPTVSGQDTLTVTADGATSTSIFNVTSQSLSVTLTDITTSPPTVVSVNPQPISEYTSSSCIAVNANYMVSGAGAAGTAQVSTSRGTLYLNSACSAAYSPSTTTISFNSAGQMQTLYLRTTSIGTAVVTVSESSGSVTGPTQAASVTFIARLTSAYTPSVTVTDSTSLVAPNTNANNPTAQFSIITATVRDGSPQNNLVQGVPVQFTLSADASGGTISPSVVLTQANGQAVATYYPGSGVTASNGVVIKTSIQSPYAPPSSTTYPIVTDLTVSGTPLFVTLGTGNQINAPSDTTFSQDWAVFVTDSNGNPIANATVTGQLVAKYYMKGTYNINTPSGPPWSLLATSLPSDGLTLAGTGTGPWCPNTDFNNDGVWLASNPIQILYPASYPADPILENTDYPYVMPGIPGNVTTTGTTNSAGYANVVVTWPQDHSNWTYVTLTVTASAGGSQSSASTSYQLPLLTADYTASPQPPGAVSPYGVNQCGIAF